MSFPVLLHLRQLDGQMQTAAAFVQHKQEVTLAQQATVERRDSWKQGPAPGPELDACRSLFCIQFGRLKKCWDLFTPPVWRSTEESASRFNPLPTASEHGRRGKERGQHGEEMLS